MRHELIPFSDSTPIATFTVVLLVHGSVGGGRKAMRVMTGATLRDMIPPGIEDEHVRIGIDGHEIYPHHWGHVKPKGGATVQILLHPGDPASLIGLLASAAGSYVSTFGLGTFIAGGTFLSAVAGAVISFAILALGQALFAQPERSRPTEETTFSINGARNRLTPYDPIPVVLGTHRFVPPLGANSYTEVAGNVQYLRMLVVWGYSSIALSDVRIGNTAIGDFVEVEQEDDLTGLNTTFTLYPGTASQDNLSITLSDTDSSNVFFQRETDLDVDEFGVTIIFPRGLYYLTWKGTYADMVQNITGDYRIAGSADPWTNFINPAVTYAGPASSGGVVTRNKTSAQRYSWRVSGLASNQYEIRMRSALISGPVNDNTAVRDVTWSALRSFKNESPIADTGIAATALRIRATDQLNGVIDQFNGLVSTLVPTWNGSNWTGASQSSNPAAIFRYILTGAPNAKAVGAAKINDAQLGAWYDFCVTKGFAYERVIDYRTNIRDLLTEVAAAGMASPELLDGKWSVLIDDVKSTVIQHFTARNSWDFSSQIMFVEVPHGLRVRFNNRDAGYEEDERVVYDDGYTSANATIFQTLDLPGITEPDNVFQIARRRLAEMRLRPEVFTFTVDMENLVATRGDRIYFSHDVPLIGQASGRISAISGTLVTLDEPVVMSTGTSYGLRVRASDGTSYLKTVTTVDGTYTAITVNNTTGIAVGDLFSFGISGEEVLDLLIKSIEGLDDLNAQITAIPYNEAIYSSADSIPAYTSIISIPISPSFNGPPNPVIEKLQSDESALTRTSVGDIEPGILAFVKGGASLALNNRLTRSQYFQARFRSSDPAAAYDAYSYTPLVEVDGAGGGILLTPVELNESYSVGVRAVGPNGETSGWTTEDHTVVGNAAAPANVDTFTMNVIGDHAYLEWTYANPPTDHTGFEIRYATNQNVTDWNTMIVIAIQVTRRDRSITIPARYGSYAIKTIDYFGTYSTTAKFINASQEDPPATNNIASSVEHPSFSGTKTNLVVDTLNTMSIDLGGGALSGTYEFGEVDLGAVYTARHTYVASVTSENTQSTMSTWTTLASVANLSGTNTASDGTQVRMEIAYSMDDVGTGQVYTDWRPFIVGDYTARWAKYRMTLTTDSATVTPVVLELSTSVDDADRVQSGQDIVSGTSTYAVTFSPDFHTLKALSIAPQNMATGDYYTITSKTRSGFSILFRNSAGSGVSRTFDYTAIGFGKERGT